MAIQDITIRSSDGVELRGWLAEPPARDAPGPGVLVIHELWGLIENQRAILERFAANGYTALAPDLYSRGSVKALCVARTLMSMQRGKGPALADLEAAREHLGGLPGVDPDRLAVAGFCMGGGFALLLATRGGVRAAAPYYGFAPSFPRDAPNSCPVVGGYGGRDRVFAPKGHALSRILDNAGVPHDVHIYPEAGHSYMTADYKEGGRIATFVGEKTMAVGYNHDAAEDSWRRMLAFFERHV